MVSPWATLATSADFNKLKTAKGVRVLVAEGVAVLVGDAVSVAV